MCPGVKGHGPIRSNEGVLLGQPGRTNLREGASGMSGTRPPSCHIGTDGRMVRGPSRIYDEIAKKDANIQSLK